MFQRRQFLFATLAGCGAAALGWRFAASRQEQAVVAVLRKRLDYLKLDEAGVQAFASDLVSRHILSGSRLRTLAAAGSLYRRLPSTGENFLAENIRHGEERIVTNYLLSSDFFTTGGDESRTVHYLGYYDPFARACGNPFARPVGT